LAHRFRFNHFSRDQPVSNINSTVQTLYEKNKMNQIQQSQPNAPSVYYATKNENGKEEVRNYTRISDLLSNLHNESAPVSKDEPSFNPPAKLEEGTAFVL
jgi:hypothetical protein